VDEVDAVFRRTAAAAVGMCPTNHHFPENLLAVLRMIARKRPKPFRWHRQIDPARWKDVNAHPCALNGWLSGTPPTKVATRFLLDVKIVRRLYGYLGEDDSELKKIMVKRFLYHTVRDLVTNTSLAIIGDSKRVPKREVRYQDFRRTWRYNGLRCDQMEPTDKVVRDLDDVIRESGPAGNTFLDYLQLGSSPLCHGRVLRHREVVLYRIGTEWTDPAGRPADDDAEDMMTRVRADYVESLARWYDGRNIPEDGRRREIYEEVAGTLGKPDERKRALVDCLTFRSNPATDLQEAAFTWLKVNGCTPLQAFGGC